MCTRVWLSYLPTQQKKKFVSINCNRLSPMLCMLGVSFGNLSQMSPMAGCLPYGSSDFYWLTPLKAACKQEDVSKTRKEASMGNFDLLSELFFVCQKLR